MAIRDPPVGSATAALRAALLTAFELWAEKELGVQMEAAMAQDLPLETTVIRVGWRAYGQCWTTGQYRDLRLGLRKRYPWAQGALTARWRISARGEQLEPSVPRNPIPEQLLDAVLVSMLTWFWARAATTL